MHPLKLFEGKYPILSWLARQDCWYTDVLLGSLVSAPGQSRSLLLTSFRHATHPGYDAAALLNDVAIVHLPRDISVGGRMMITRA